jgi:hypothetical protein
MDRYTDLDALLDHIWTYVVAGANDREHPFYTPTFVTALDRPTARTVVVREASRADRMLAFHTDRRAHKVGEIRGNKRVAWHHWNAETREQLRLVGTATVDTSGPFADALWAEASPRQRLLYVKPKSPNTPADAPTSGLADGVQALDDPTAEDVAAGRRFFAAVRTVIDEIAWLHLHPDGHYRARFRWQDDAWRSTWIVP